MRRDATRRDAFRDRRRRRAAVTVSSSPLVLLSRREDVIPILNRTRRAALQVLFVIGVCAAVAPKPLQLTWWPLARDCTYYTISLGTLAVFFSVTSPQRIVWWEALTLFALYWCVRACARRGPIDRSRARARRALAAAPSSHHEDGSSVRAASSPSRVVLASRALGPPRSCRVGRPPQSVARA